jgi:hypothetical protein
MNTKSARAMIDGIASGTCRSSSPINYCALTSGLGFAETGDQQIGCAWIAAKSCGCSTANPTGPRRTAAAALIHHRRRARDRELVRLARTFDNWRDELLAAVGYA